MIKCDKCGFGHKTSEELAACKSWEEMQADTPITLEPTFPEPPAKWCCEGKDGKDEHTDDCRYSENDRRIRNQRGEIARLQELHARASEEIDRLKKQLAEGKKDALLWQEIAADYGLKRDAAEAEIIKLNKQQAEAQQQIEQLAGDVRACVADYNDAKKRAESAEKQLAEARAQAFQAEKERDAALDRSEMRHSKLIGPDLLAKLLSKAYGVHVNNGVWDNVSLPDLHREIAAAIRRAAEGK